MWKDYDEGYEVSTEGQVRHKIRQKILKMPLNQDGYNCVCLYGKNKQRVHRLIALTFIPNPNNLPEVDHINRDKTDNRLENLRWATRSINCLNTKVRKDSKTGVRAVYQTNGRFRASYRINGKRYYTTTFDTVEEAVQARNTALT
jgi:hypothetical protein